MVTSYFGNVETRSAMRRAFPSRQLANFGVRRVFLLGLAPPPTKERYTTQAAIVDEGRRFGDLVQGGFVEDYRNLTYKHVMGHGWVGERCGGVEFVVKMDDDIVVDLMKVRKLLLGFNEWVNGASMAGYVLKGMKPIRETRNKWFVNQEEYAGTEYPTFLSGWFYITTPETSKKIYRLSQQIAYFWIDDVYVTGILAAKLKIQHIDLHDLFTVHPEFLRCCINDVLKHGYDCEFSIGPNGGDNNLFYEFNKIMKRCFYSVCKRRIKFLNETCVAERKFNVGKGEPQVNSYRLF